MLKTKNFMIKKIAAITFIATLAVSSAFAQRRDFRKERAELAREEREERRRDRVEPLKLNYGSNIIRVSPFTAMDVGVGFGLSYEKLFGKDQMVGLVLPLHLMFGVNDGNFGTGYGYNSDATKAYGYFTPGLKIYPFGQRKVTYAVGPTLMFGYGGGKEWRYNYGISGPGYEEYVDVTKLRVGLLVSNYLNFNISESFNIGLEAGVGVRYLDRETISGSSFMQNGTYSQGINPTGNFSLTLGYRF